MLFKSMIVMPLKNGFLLCLVLMLDSVVTGSKGVHQAGSQTHGNVGRIEMKPLKPACRQLDGRCIPGKKVCPDDKPFEKPYGKPYCKRRARCCYPDCPNQSFAYYHACDECNNSTDALNFVKERWGDSTEQTYKVLGAFVFGGSNSGGTITYTNSTWDGVRSCRNDYASTCACYRGRYANWENCDLWWPSVCEADHSIKTGNVFIDSIGCVL